MTYRARWSVVVPLKPLHRAKSRLAVLSGPLRRRLVVAMARDVRDAVLGCRAVEEVVIVTADPQWRDILAAPGLRVVPESPGDSLNGALRRGADACRLARPGCAVAALTADVPALRSAELGLALQHARQAPTSLVPDAAGRGTTLYAARAHADFRPRYGDGSRARHIAGGAQETVEPRLAGIRQDVDTVADLERARALGLGRHTAAVAPAVLRTPAPPHRRADRRPASTSW